MSLLFSDFLCAGQEANFDLAFRGALILLGCLAAQVALVIAILKRLDRVFVDKNNRLRRIASATSHELKTPLTLILANVDVLEMENGPDELIDDIREEGQQMTRIVNKMVTLSQLEEGEWTLSISTVNLSPIVDRALEHFKPLAHNRGLKASRDIEEDVYVDVDEGEIKQVLFILLDNAIKYCDEGGTVTARLRSAGKGAELVIENSYAEAANAEISRFFDRFYRAEKSSATVEGDGLGLTLALMSVKKHGGSINAYAREDDGVIGFQVVL